MVKSCFRFVVLLSLLFVASCTSYKRVPYLQNSEEYGKNAIGSIDMLVYQAAKAHEIWVCAKYTDSQLQTICKLTADKLR